MARDMNMPDDKRVARLGIKVWTLIGIAIILVGATMVLGKVWPAVSLLLVGAIVGFICAPITNFLEDHKVPRALGSLIALLVVIAAAALVVILLLPPFIKELIDVLQQVPSYISQIREAFQDYWNANRTSDTILIENTLNQYMSNIASYGVQASASLVTTLSNGIVSNIMSAASGMVTLFLGLVLAYWLSKDYPKIAHELQIIAGPDHEYDLSVMLAVMSRSMGGYMRGIVTTSIVGGMLSYLGFMLIGHPYAGLMGTIVGIFHFVPVIGPWLAAIVAALLALFVNPLLALETILVSLVAQNVTDNVISPLVMRSAVKVHPALSLLGIIVGDALGGILGMALAIPLTAAIRSVFVYYFETRTKRQLVAYDGALFASTPFKDDKGNVVPAFDALDDDKFFESTRLINREEKKLCAYPEEKPADFKPTVADKLEETAKKLGDTQVFNANKLKKDR